jgi:phosphonate transport system permease protein
LRLSGVTLAVLGIISWAVGDFGVTEIFTERRFTNLVNFLHELWPYPLQSEPFDSRVLAQWTGDLMRAKGYEAAVTTLAISIAAIFLAGISGAVISFFAARTLATPSPFLPVQKVALPVQLAWTVIAGTCRLFMIFVRAIPEYVWAFLLFAMLGPTTWPLVLALAIHNAGILGRLDAEVVENTESPPLVSLRALGANRSQIFFAAIFPMAFSRFLLFFLYRWETCVREATVLGMLGISSLGFWIQDARARNHYDEMFLLILLGGALVLIGDLLSAFAREWVRRQD